MLAVAPLLGLRRRVLAFRGDRLGVAAVEFAFILPLLLVLLMSLIDFSRAFNENKRVMLVSSTISDLVSQQATTNGLAVSDLDAIVTASTAIMTPYPARGLKISVSAVLLTPKPDHTCCQAQVQWSMTRGGALRPCNTQLQQVASSTPPAPTNILAAMVDPSLLAASSSVQLIVTDIDDRYAPFFGSFTSFFSGAFHRTSYRALRAWGNLALQSGASATAGEKSQVCFNP